MEILLVSALFLHFLKSVEGADWSCFLDGYHKCDGWEKCCHDSHVCVGKDGCISIGAIVGICISVVVGIVSLVVLIYVCKRQKKATVGTVFSTQPSGSAIGQQSSNTGNQIQPPGGYGMQTYNTLPAGSINQ